MNNNIQFLLYSMPDDKGKIQVVIKDETLWCTQRAMAELFGVGVPAISKHLNNIYEPTLKSKACLKCLYFTKIISALCCYLEYFSYLYTVN